MTILKYLSRTSYDENLNKERDDICLILNASKSTEGLFFLYNHSHSHPKVSFKPCSFAG